MLPNAYTQGLQVGILVFARFIDPFPLHTWNILLIKSMVL